MNFLTSLKSQLKWALTGQADFIDHPDWLLSGMMVIDTKTGEYINRNTGKRSPADRQSIAAVNNSFYTVKKVGHNWLGRKQKEV